MKDQTIQERLRALRLVCPGPIPGNNDSCMCVVVTKAARELDRLLARSATADSVLSSTGREMQSVRARNLELAEKVVRLEKQLDARTGQLNEKLDTIARMRNRVLIAERRNEQQRERIMQLEKEVEYQRLSARRDPSDLATIDNQREEINNLREQRDSGREGLSKSRREVGRLCGEIMLARKERDEMRGMRRDPSDIATITNQRREIDRLEKINRGLLNRIREGQRLRQDVERNIMDSAITLGLITINES